MGPAEPTIEPYIEPDEWSPHYQNPLHKLILIYTYVSSFQVFRVNFFVYIYKTYHIPRPFNLPR
jgi:hypothetical protein